MKSMFAASCLVGALGLAAGAGAQTGQETKKADTSKEHKMTVTGCLREATGTTGEYLLTKTPASTGAPSETGSAAATYRLVGGGKVNLKDHVGHKVEITGNMAGHETSPGSSEKPAGSAPQEQKITVTSLKHIAANCEPETSK